MTVAKSPQVYKLVFLHKLMRTAAELNGVIGLSLRSIVIRGGVGWGGSGADTREMRSRARPCLGARCLFGHGSAGLGRQEWGDEP